MRTRNFSYEEKKQLNITKQFHLKRLEEGFNWRKLTNTVMVLFSFILVIIFFNDYWISHIAKIGVVVVSLVIWFMVKNFKSDTKESRKLLRVIQQAEGAGSLEVIDYDCTKAIEFEEGEDGSIFGIEVGENQLLFWWEDSWSEGRLLPNTKIEIIENEDIAKVIGKRIIILGDPIQPIKLRQEIQRDNLNKLGDHREVLSTSVDQFLDSIAAKYST